MGKGKFDFMFYSLKLSYNKIVIFGSCVVFCFSTLDGALTLWGLCHNAIKEANPVMRSLITFNPYIFMIYKMALPIVLGIISWKIHDRSQRLIRYGLVLLLCIYTAIVGFHIYWIVQN